MSTLVLVQGDGSVDSIGIFLRSKTRKKDGKEHHYWSEVENRRVAGGRVVQRHVLYLGEINGGFVPLHSRSRLQLRLPRQWGGVLAGLPVVGPAAIGRLLGAAPARSRKSTRWLNVLNTVVSYRLIDPGSKWRLHRHWFDHSAIVDLHGEDFAVAHSYTIYRCLNHLLEHKQALFSYLQERWRSLFGARFDILLYDLTSTYFECDLPEHGKRKFGYSRDQRFDCVQVEIALTVIPDGFPLAYEVLAGNTRDQQALTDFLAKIAAHYGKAERTWVMDRGFSTEETLVLMRARPTRALSWAPKKVTWPSWRNPFCPNPEQRCAIRSRSSSWCATARCIYWP